MRLGNPKYKDWSIVHLFQQFSSLDYDEVCIVWWSWPMMSCFIDSSMLQVILGSVSERRPPPKCQDAAETCGKFHYTKFNGFWGICWNLLVYFFWEYAQKRLEWAFLPNNSGLSDCKSASANGVHHKHQVLPWIKSIQVSSLGDFSGFSNF